MIRGILWGLPTDIGTRIMTWFCLSTHLQEISSDWTCKFVGRRPASEWCPLISQEVSIRMNGWSYLGYYIKATQWPAINNTNGPVGYRMLTEVIQNLTDSLIRNMYIRHLLLRMLTDREGYHWWSSMRKVYASIVFRKSANMIILHQILLYIRN